MKMKPEQNMLIKSMGKLLKITAIFHNVNEANKYLEKHKDEGVIACYDPYIFIANLYDKGE